MTGLTRSADKLTPSLPTAHNDPALSESRVRATLQTHPRLTGRVWTNFWRFIGVEPPFGDDYNHYAELEAL
jgi:hypothetical protein